LFELFWILTTEQKKGQKHPTVQEVTWSNQIPNSTPYSLGHIPLCVCHLTQPSITV